jgi:hypothetical protein
LGTGEQENGFDEVNDQKGSYANLMNEEEFHKKKCGLKISRILLT